MVEASNSPSFKTHKTPQNERKKVGTHDNNANMPDYFRSSKHKAADKRAGEVLTNKIHIEFGDFFQAQVVMRVHLVCS